MEGPKRERWMELCEQAANEQDPAQLLTLIEEINRILQEKEDRLKRDRQQFATAGIRNLSASGLNS